MSVAHQIEQLQNYPDKATEQFRDQLQRGRDAQLQFDGQVRSDRGIDRSGELIPLPRPQVVRTLIGD